MKKYLLLAGVGFCCVSGAALAAIDCATPPSCADLGYTMTADDCDGKDTLKCPFDQTKAFCVSTPATTVTCTVGAILYNDLKCYNKKPDGKTAIGVVFDTRKKLAISLDKGKNGIQWGSYGTDISSLTNCTTSNYTTCATNGKDNTQKIVAAQGENASLSAGSCYTSTYGGLSKGSWFLPSASELKTLYDNKTEVNAAIKTAGDTTILNVIDWYWSSNENSRDNILALNLYDGNVYSTSIKNHSSGYDYARCAVAYY